MPIPHVSPVSGGLAPPLARANCDGCAYLQTVAHSLLPSVSANCDGCAACSYFLTMTHSLLAGRGAGRPQCRPRANCDGCAYPWTLTLSRPQCGSLSPAHSVGQGLTVTAAPTIDLRTLTHTRQVRPTVNGLAARVGWAGRGRRHADLDSPSHAPGAEFRKPPDPPPARVAVPNCRGF